MMFVGGGEGSLTPLNILGAKLMAWYDGNDPAGNNTAHTDNTTPSPWVDKSGNARNVSAVGGGSGTLPVYRSNIVNGKGIVRFDGADDGFRSLANGDFMFDNGGIEIWAVAKSDESGSGTIIMEGASGAGSAHYYLTDIDASNQYQFGFTNSSNVDRIVNAQSRSTNDWDLIIATDSGAATGSSLEVVDVDSGTTGAYTRDATAFDQFAIGQSWRTSVTFPFDGDIAEILVLSSAATSAERSALTAYFNLKFGEAWTPN